MTVMTNVRQLNRWLILLVVCLGPACTGAPDSSSSGSVPKPEAAVPPSSSAPAPPAPSAQALPADEQEHLSSIVAEVNGRPLYRAFYEQSLSYIRDRLPAGQDAATVERYINAKFEALDRIIDDELLFQEAEKLGIMASDDEVNADFQRAAAAAGGESHFLSSMRAAHISRSDAIEGIRRRLTVNKYIRERLSAGMTATDEEALGYYNANLKRFTPEEYVKTFQITIICPRSATADLVASARQRAAKILQNIRAGQSFEAMAREYSEDKRAPDGGNAGFVKRGVGPPEFDAVIFSMKAGEVSEIIRTDAGFHILKVADRKGGSPRPFEVVKEKCRDAVLNQKRARAVAQVAGRLRASANIVTHLD